MTQVLILFGVFLLALMLHYFVVMEGFQDAATPEQTPFSDLIDKLTFFSTPPAPPAVVVATTTAATSATAAEAETKALEESATKTDAKAAEASATKADAKKVEGAPATTAETTKDVKTGPKDVANESVAERSTKPLIPEEVSSKVTNALQQGKEFLQSGCKPKPRPEPPCPGPEPPCPRCPEPKPVPFPCNSSDYIRKDQIPCWGCTLK